MQGSALKKSGSLFFLSGLGIGFWGLFFSTFITSLGTVFLLISIILQSKNLSAIKRSEIIVFSLPILFVFTDYFRTGDHSIVSAKLLLSLGFAIIAISCYVNRQTLIRYQSALLIAAVSSIILIDILSVGNYFLHKEELDRLLLQSKSIPIIGGMHHIHFGILNALSIVLVLYVFIFRKQKLNVTVLWLGLAVLIISFHILSSRTGLVSLYCALAIALLFYAIREKEILKAGIGLVLVIAINFAALNLSSSFKNKVANSIEDIESWDERDAVNYKSMGMRLEAYKTSVELISNHFFVGVGSGEAEAQLQAYYVKLDTALYKENRIGPHNQFLEFGIKYGIFGLLYICLFFYCWLKWSLKPLNYGLMTIVLVILISSQFESLLERQVSIFFTAAILPIAQICFSKEN